MPRALRARCLPTLSKNGTLEVSSEQYTAARKNPFALYTCYFFCKICFLSSSLYLNKKNESTILFKHLYLAVILFWDTGD